MGSRWADCDDDPLLSETERSELALAEMDRCEHLDRMSAPGLMMDGQCVVCGAPSSLIRRQRGVQQAFYQGTSTLEKVTP